MFYSIIGAVIIVCGLYTVVWGKSKDSVNTTTDAGKGEGQELPIKDGTRSGSDIFDSIEVNVPGDMKMKGEGKSNFQPSARSS